MSCNDYIEAPSRRSKIISYNDLDIFTDIAKNESTSPVKKSKSNNKKTNKTCTTKPLLTRSGKMIVEFTVGMECPACLFGNKFCNKDHFASHWNDDHKYNLFWEYHSTNTDKYKYKFSSVYKYIETSLISMFILVQDIFSYIKC